MDITTSISADSPQQPGMNFALLLREGLEYIQKLAGDRWSDYNLHDPGITILEQLCFAITDLSYRLNFDIKDLLADPPLPSGENSISAKNQVFTAAEILTVNPLTVNDYRKLIIDIDGVRNAWLIPRDDPFPDFYHDPEEAELTFNPADSYKQVKLNGLYNIFIKKADPAINDDAIRAEVKERISSNRNLCEDFYEIRVLGTEYITVKAEIAIGDDCDANDLMTQIIFRLEEYISPSINRYSIDEMIAMGKTIEEVFYGPRLKHGFIDDKQLDVALRRVQLRTSELFHVLMEINGIKSIETLTISGNLGIEQEWVLDLDPECAPEFKDIDGISLYKKGARCAIDNYKGKLNELRDVSKKHITELEQNIAVPLGRYRYLSDYETIQNHFPLHYGIGYIGLSDAVTVKRKAQAKQLQAYLMFFDQVLANYFAQLEHFKDIFSLEETENRTYYTQMLFGAAGLDEILQLDEQGLNQLAEEENSESALQRKSRFLEHLISRFGEKFPDSSLLTYPSISPDYIRDKINFLRDCPRIGYERGKAFDYTNKDGIWDTFNVSGLKKRISRILGLPDYKRKDLAYTHEEGFHLVEHILLRPGKLYEPEGAFLRLIEDELDENVIYPMPPDPYSFQLSFIFPDWPERFRDVGFKNLIHEVLISEVPAHITFYIICL